MNKQLSSQSMGRQFARYAFPSVLGMVATSLYTIVDGIFVGRGVGELALGAVNIAFPFIMLQIAFTMLLAVGGANLYSQLKGGGDTQGADNVFAQSMALLVLISTAVNLLVSIFPGTVAKLLGADQSLLSQAADYLKWMAIFGIIFLPGLGLSIFVRNDGNPTLEMAGTLTGALVNIYLDYLFIIVFGWGVAGAAIASGLGQTVSTLIYLSHFLTKRNTLKIRMPKFIGANIKRMFLGGFSSFLMEFCQSAITLSFNVAMMALMGASGVAAYSIVMYVCSIFSMVLIGVVQGAQPILSFNHGQGNIENENKIYRLGLATNLILTVVFYVLVFLLGDSLASLFSEGNSQLTDLAASMMRLYFLGFFPTAITMMNIMYFQTTEREKPSILVSALRCVGFVQVFLLILPWFMGLTGICLSLFFGEACNCAISMYLYKKHKSPSQAPALPTAKPALKAR